jgi:uncharacterized protein (TIGR00369 family)
MTQTGAGPAVPPTADDEPALLARWRERRPRYLALFAGDAVRLDVARSELEMAFDVGSQWGHVIGLQGGIVAGMLDSAMAQCLILCSGFSLGPPTLELKVSYLAPARPGAFRALGQVLHRGRSVAFARAELRDAKGVLVATASATSRLVPRDPEAPL